MQNDLPKFAADYPMSVGECVVWPKTARRSNREEGISGRFWEGRNRAQLILEEPSLLACAAYVDLNPARAAMADTPEASEFTGAKERIDDLRQRESNSDATHDWERSRCRDKSGWLSPVEIDERKDDAGADLEPTNPRASRKGFLSISLSRYLKLLDWTGRQVQTDKRGSIPAHLAPILERLGIDVSRWCDLVLRFGRLFRRVAGNRSSVSEEAARRGQNYMHAPGLACFTAESARSSTTISLLLWLTRFGVARRSCAGRIPLRANRFQNDVATACANDSPSKRTTNPLN